MSDILANLAADNRLLGRLVLAALALFCLVAIAFGSYYYWDRYVHIGDKSPLELGVEHLEEMIRENPDDVDARVALAQFYFENGAYADAIDQAEQVLAAFPDNDNALYIQGVSLAHSGQPEAAVSPLEQFSSIRKESPMAKTDAALEAAYYFLGQSYLETGQPEAAITVLSDALEINRTDADAMYQLGLAYAALDDHEQAIRQYADAVRFVPDFAEAYRGMITSYSALDMAAYAAYARGMEAYSTKDMNTAREHLEEAAASLPDFAPVFVGLGLTYEQLGDLSLAETQLLHALEIQPDDFLANHALGRVQLALAENS
ncbi:MAG: tetratricopeptide repeat protein [Anaerolineae bacterium]